MLRRGAGMKILFKNFCKLTEDESNMIWQARNTPVVREKMYNQNEITWKEHCLWMVRLSGRIDCLYYLVYINNKAVGVIDITSIEQLTCEWGYYLFPEWQGSGFGILLEKIVIDFVFFTLNKELLFCSVIEENENVYKNHMIIFGFIPDRRYTFTTDDGKKTRLFKGLSLGRNAWMQHKSQILERCLKVLKFESTRVEWLG